MAKEVKKSIKKDWHNKIADNRGEDWRKNMLKGRRDAQLNPSLIRLARIKKGIAQGAIASKIESSVSTFGSIERGKRMVKLDAAKLISGIVGLPVEKIFKKSGKDKYIAICKSV